MHTFHTILFASEALDDDVDALAQALCIASHNKAALRALIVCPDFPRELGPYRQHLERSLVQRLADSIRTARDATGVGETEVPVEIEVEAGSMPAERIVRYVLRHADDLLVKQAARPEGSHGIKAVDMELLRKCPCPLWLGRPVRKPWRAMKVAVAVDPECHEPEGRDLTRRLLQLSRSLADRCDGELRIVSCWDFPFESSLRNSPWMHTPVEDVERTVFSACKRHRAALDKAIADAGIGGRLQLEHVRGNPERLIPDVVKQADVDILVMGTVARTGIPGFIIGNTAENVVQQLHCSLLALKPYGFVSPVKAY